MASRPLRIRMLGLWPSVFEPCGPSCARPFMNAPVEALARDQEAETPAFVRENGVRAHEIAEHLFRDFGDRVRIEVVGLDSPRGILLGVRHRVGKGFAVVVDRGSVVRDPEDYEPVRAAVIETLRAMRTEEGDQKLGT